MDELAELVYLHIRQRPNDAHIAHDWCMAYVMHD